ncbi:protein of unknown function [Nitrosovibrio tenuis]|uniref:DUF1772 domain-containing protein n=2 Tax=Nitrosovibrio tenuis TaxID=1233 RepID=A0A1H7R2V4_9PROT|nr:protein of unknown function [Nitrosovibrio tenuis]
MLHVAQFVAVFCGTVFAGAALYINLVEHPARMGCDMKTAATIWAPSYKRATMMQAPLAILSFAGGMSAWLLDGGLTWLIGQYLLVWSLPFTFIVIMPTNHQLLAPGRDLASSETRALLKKWGKLHAVRTILSLLASGIYIVELLRV